MFPLVWSGCGQDTVMLLEARLTWCMAGTAEGTGVGVMLVGFPGAGEQEWGTGSSKEETGSLGAAEAHLRGWCLH